MKIELQLKVNNAKRGLRASDLLGTIKKIYLVYTRGGHFCKSVRKSANCGLKFLFADLQT